MARSHVCPLCNTAQGAGDGYCTECGGTLVVARYCDNCGVLAGHDGDFCSECGERLPTPPPTGLPPSPPDPGDTIRPPIRPADDPTSDRLVPPTPPPRIPDPVPPRMSGALMPRPTATPVRLQPAPPAPTTPSAGGQAAAMVVAMSAAGGIALLNPVIALIYLGLFASLLTHPARDLVAASLDRTIDWLWEDPVLRKRLLGE